jgi:hypothetical protein
MFRKPLAEPTPGPPPKRKPLTPAAEGPAPPKEVGGPTGPESTRYGDWENRGAASDF